MKIHKNGDQTIIIWDGGSNSLEGFSTSAQGYLEQYKQKLSKEEWSILNAEEAIKDQEADEPYKWRDWGRVFNTIKDSKLQDFLPDLRNILDLFYKRVIDYIEDKTDAGIKENMLKKIEQRKQEITADVLKTIEDFKLYSLTKTYSNVTYDCSPLTSIELTRWNETIITHIFNPVRDINVIEGVGSSSGWWESTYSIRISKDVFTSSDASEKNNNNYLVQQLWYNTKEELFEAMKNDDINETWKKAIFLGQTIKRLRDDTN